MLQYVTNSEAMRFFPHDPSDPKAKINLTVRISAYCRKGALECVWDGGKYLIAVEDGGLIWKYENAGKKGRKAKKKVIKDRPNRRLMVL